MTNKRVYTSITPSLMVNLLDIESRNLYQQFDLNLPIEKWEELRELAQTIVYHIGDMIECLKTGGDLE